MNIEEYLDSTYLKKASELNITNEENKKKNIDLIFEAIKYNFKLVMIRPEFVKMAKEIILNNNSKVLIGTVIDFPLGSSSTDHKIKEAISAIDNGADELDFVADYNLFKQKRFIKFDKDIIEGTKLACDHSMMIKWIIETGALSNQEIISITKRISSIVVGKFPDFFKNLFIKTSTGYYSGFGATIKDVKTIKRFSKLPVKASGGVSNFSQFIKMIEAGAERIGTSNAVNIFLKNN